MKILIRLAGEIHIKSSRISRKFQKQLFLNLKSSLEQKACDFKIKTEWSLIILECVDPKVFAILNNIFGIKYYSVVISECNSNIKDIVATGFKSFKDKVAGKRFAVSTRRNGKHEFSSEDVSRDFGGALDRSCMKAKVDLSNPEVTIFVEIINETTYFFISKEFGVGGLPLGVSGHAVSLVSGGFDSIVSSWMLQKRGLTLDFIFFSMGGKANERAVLRLLKEFVSSWYLHSSDPANIHIIDFNPLIKLIQEKIPRPYAQVVLKKVFYKISEKVANKVGAQAIITGEALGQVSSQTLQNLNAIEHGVDLPVFRPLISFDKDDIIALSRKIGSFEASSKLREFCRISRAKPVTSCSSDKLSVFEEKISDSAINEALSLCHVKSLREITQQDLVGDYILIDHIPDGAKIIDCQSEEEYREKSLPGAEHWELYTLIENFKKLSKNNIYLVYCRFGSQSVMAAESMQKEGYDCYSLIGGIEKYKI